MSLSGCAQAVLTDLYGNSRISYQAFREALLLRFDNGGKMEVFRSQLKSSVTGKDDLLPELAQVIQQVVRQAYPDTPLSAWKLSKRTTLSMQLQIQVSAVKYLKLDPDR